MTVGIGVLASQKTIPDTAVLISDTKGSFGQTHSMNRLHKIFSCREVGLYGIGAGKIDRASELFGLIRDAISQIFSEKRHGDLLDAVHAGSDLYKRMRFRFEILPQHAHPPHSVPVQFREADLTPNLLEKWRNFYFGCQMVVAAFNKQGQPTLFRLDGTGGVENFTFPGFTAVGVGAQNAMFWLSYRNHNLSMSVKRAAYHAFEAKLMGESSPFVNEKVDVLIVNSEGFANLTDFKPAPKHAPITLEILRKMFKQYGPKETAALEGKHQK